MVAAVSAQLPEFRDLILIQRVNSLFFNQKIDSLPLTGQGQLLEAIGQLGCRVKILIHRNVSGRKPAQVPSLFVVTPALQ